MKNFSQKLFSGFARKIGIAWLPAVCFVVLFSSNINAQNAGDLVIAEIAADPSSAALTGGSEPYGEYFVICNRTTTNFNLNGFTVSDNSTTIITLPSYNLAGNSCVVVIAGTTAVFSAAPTGYGCANTPTNSIIIPTAQFFNGLSNTGDRLGLFTPTGTLIDGVSYGTDTTYLNPAAPDVFNNSGTTLIRVGYPTTPSQLPDTNSNADFTSRVGTPCDAPQVTTAASANIGGRITGTNGRGIKNVRIMLTGGSLTEPIYATSTSFGYYRFPEVTVGETYVLQVFSKNYIFNSSSIVVNLIEDLTEANFTGQPRGLGLTGR